MRVSVTEITLVVLALAFYGYLLLHWPIPVGPAP